MRKIILFSFLIICFNLINGHPNSKNFFPLQAGNKYVYLHSWSSFSGGGSDIQVAKILRDTIINGNKYFWAVNFPYFNNKWIRRDSITGSLYSLSITQYCSLYAKDSLIDSLSCKLRDTVKNCLTAHFPVCIDTSYTTIFSLNKQRKSFHIFLGQSNFSANRWETFVDSIGIYYINGNYYFPGGGGGYSYALKGCVINGILYGDTSTVIGIKQINEKIPISFFLHQNYPNPFNPTTKIRFDIPSVGTVSRTVRLIIYDLLGREVATLVNEQLKPGKYEVDWNGSGIASGVYFYSLITTEFTETKKCILLK